MKSTVAHRRARFAIQSVVFAAGLLVMSASAIAQSTSPCTTTKQHMTVSRDADLKRINNLLGQNVAMANNAKKCIDRVIALAQQVQAPRFPNLAQLSMDKIMSYLANQACKVVVNQAEGVVADINGAIRPIGDQLAQFERQANSTIGSVQWSGGTSDPSYNFNQPGSTAGGTVTLPPPTTPPPTGRDPNCRLGYGVNCNTAP